MIVPFVGAARELERLVVDLQAIRRAPSDELLIAHNGAGGIALTTEQAPVVRVLDARGLRTPAFARNHAAAVARGEWLVFIDADTRPSPALLDAYFDPSPAERTAVLGGAIRDVAHEQTLVARHVVARAQMSEKTTLARKGSPYAQTANCAVRRLAFEEVGGFEPSARAGEDADLCFRLAGAGWLLEERPRAVVDHRAREQLREWLAQLVRHGSGAAWLNRRWRGEFPSPHPTQLLARVGRDLAAAASSLSRGERAELGFALLDAAGALAFELGRLTQNIDR